MNAWSRTKKLIAAGVLVLASFGGGAAVMVAGSASAESSTSATSNADEEELTGDTLDKVMAAVKAEYPGATIERAETDSDGTYEAHITTADNDEVTVELDATFAVTGTEDHRGRGGHDGRRGGHTGEEALTGNALAKVTAAVEAEYPGATIERAETDSDGTYEAHITTADDETLTVELDGAFAVTGTEDH